MRRAKTRPAKIGKSGERDSDLIRKIFRTLEAEMGVQHWWPAESDFEVVVGAYLTQNTAWTNVERAMANLRSAGVLSIAGIRETPIEELERLVRPAGYFRQKAARLKRFVEHLDARHSGSLELSKSTASLPATSLEPSEPIAGLPGTPLNPSKPTAGLPGTPLNPSKPTAGLPGTPLETMFATALPELRQELLGLNGIGPETADSILLYAASKEVFVVDAYTRRIWQRHRLARAGTGYEEIRAGVEKALTEEEIPAGPAQVQNKLPRPTQKQVRMARPQACSDSTSPLLTNGKSLYPMISVHPPSVASGMPRSELSRRFNEFHALLVQVGKHFCLKAAPRCDLCPLRPLLPPGAHPR